MKTDGHACNIFYGMSQRSCDVHRIVKMSVFNKLPVELMLSIIDDLNLRDAETMYESLSDTEKNGILGDILRKRIDPCVYLSKLTNRPQALLDILEKHSCIIGGRCVLPYFFPNINLPEERWRIHCPNNGSSNLMKDLRNIGMIWRDTSRSIISHRSIEDSNLRAYLQLPEGVKLHVGFSMNGRNTYTLLEIVEMYDETPIHGIIRSLTSATQCYIASSFACHMYYTEVENKHATTWANRLGKDITVYRLIYDESCPSCSVVLSRNRTRSVYLNLVHTRCVKYALNISDDEIHKKIVETFDTNPEITRSLNISNSDIARAYITECKCDYNVDFRYIKACVDFGLKIDVYHINRNPTTRSMDDNISYIYKFRPLEINSLEHIRLISWHECSYGTTLECYRHHRSDNTSDTSDNTSDTSEDF